MDTDRPRFVDLRPYIAEADCIAQALTERWVTVWPGEHTLACCAIGHVFTLYKAPLSSGRIVYHRRCQNCGRTQHVD